MKFLSGLIVGCVLAAVLVFFLPDDIVNNAAINSESEVAKPLYWVAPMDANYRRDGPGKSPMGMDLVPVYGINTDSNAPVTTPGTVTIAANVENNLGVRTAAVIKRELQAKIKTVGYVGYDQDKLVHLHPRVEGWIEKLYVKAEGDPVAEGQALYALYSPELVNAQEDLLLALNRGELRLIEGAKSRLRALKLAEKTIDELLRSRKVMQTVTYYAPQSGVVESLSIREGFFVQPGSTLLSIGALDTVWIEADVFARQANYIKAGLSVDIQVPHLPGRHFTGELAYVYPTLTTDTRTLRVRIRLNNAEKFLRPNMFAEINITGAAVKPVLAVPRAAVIRTGDQDRVVLALGDGQFKSVAVQVGRMDKDNIEITYGLQEGDEVVVSAQFLLDSESSKSSDFLRMQAAGEASDSHSMPTANLAEVDGVIVSIDLDARRIVINRGPVAIWNRPAATVEFLAANNIDLSKLTEAQKIRFRFAALAGEFTLLAILPKAGESAAPVSAHAHHHGGQL